MYTTRSYVDAQGVTITFYVWQAQTPAQMPAPMPTQTPAQTPAQAAKPRGIVQIAHGVGEYALRYERLAEALAAAGYTVYADDHRGHGATGLAQWGEGSGRLGHLGVGGHPATVEAVRQLTHLARAENPGIPVTLLGHSWGSLMAQMLVDEHADEYDSVVLTGTAYRTPLSMNGGDLNRRHAHLGTTGFEWLSRDPAVAEAMSTDPLAVEASVLTLFGLRDSLRLYGRPSRNPRHDVPLLVMVGGDDPLGGPKSADKLVAAYRSRAGFTDVELIVYEGARHEIFNETNKEEVTRDLIDWLDARS